MITSVIPLKRRKSRCFQNLIGCFTGKCRTMDCIRIIGISLEANVADEAITVEITVCVMCAEVFTDGSSLHGSNLIDVMVHEHASGMISEKLRQFLTRRRDVPPKEYNGYSRSFQWSEQLSCCRKRRVFTGLNADKISARIDCILDLVGLCPETAVRIHNIDPVGAGCFQNGTDLRRKGIRKVGKQEDNMMPGEILCMDRHQKKEHKKKSAELFRRNDLLQDGDDIS